MTIDLAIEYIPRRMRDLGFGNDYYIRFRHLMLQPSERLDIVGDNQYFILVDEVSDITINSDLAQYDLADPFINEQCYEHQGSISIQNNSTIRKSIRFIQVVPKHIN